MNNSQILKTGKYTFLVSFIAGNICLFGYIISKYEAFAISGFYLLYIATFINLVVLIGLLIYGIFKKDQFKTCLKSVAILLVNIPIAYIYAAIGLELL